MKSGISPVIDQLAPGMVIRLQIGSFGEFKGVIAWQNSEEAGTKFTHDPCELADVVMGLAMYG